MTISYTLLVQEHGRLAFEASLNAALEVGRQEKDEPAPYCLIPATHSRLPRLIVARLEENSLPRHYFELEPLPDNRARVTNLSKVLPISILGDESICNPEESVILPVPLRLALGSRILLVEGESLRTLGSMTIAPGTHLTESQQIRPLEFDANQIENLAVWLQHKLGVLQSVVGSGDFFASAATALVKIIGLDHGRVLLKMDADWKTAASFPEETMPATSWKPSQPLLDRVVHEKLTAWEVYQETLVPEAVLHESGLAIASPLLDRNGGVVGALYGRRNTQQRAAVLLAPKLEAVLVETLANSVATGMALQERERAAAKAQNQFQQFFGPQFARLLEEEPQLLEARELEVTTLFCDIRAFSRFSERLGPAATVKWLGDVMTELTKCVIDQEGLVVDYVGDEVMAMWGAPKPQPDHAIRAASAACAMFDLRENLNERWQTHLGELMSFGIGINSGPAHVGNTGSQHKFKYGPLGNTVNLASRVQGLTKYLKCRLLVTTGTQKYLDKRFISRRICQTRVVNIEEPVVLFEVEKAGSEARRLFFKEFQDALDAFEGGDFARAARAAGTLLLDHPGDGPLQLLLSRAANQLMNEDAEFDPVWAPPGK